MAYKEKYDQVFIESFGVDQKSVAELEYQSIPEWDSVGHMTLIAGLEEVFDITIEIDDIIDFSSYTRGIELLKKYEVEL